MKPEKSKIATRKARVGAFVLDIPVEWVVDRNDWGYDWAGDEDDTVTLLTKYDIFQRPDDQAVTDRSPSEFVEEFARASIDAIKHRKLISPITIDRTQSGCVVVIQDDIDNDSGRLRRYQWHIYKGRTDHVLAVFWVLEVAYPLPDAKRLFQLCDLFRAQALSIEMFLTNAFRGDATPLKDLTVDTLFTIRIPDWWSYERVVMPHGDPCWSCWDQHGRPGKLVIAYDFGELAPEVAGTIEGILQRMADAHTDDEGDPERNRLSLVQIKAPLGRVVRIIDDEKPRPLDVEDVDRFYVRHHQWFYLMTDGRNGMRLFFNLRIPQRHLGHRDAGLLPDLIEREILALRPLPPFEPIAP
jgi:hypothetical protein